MADVKICPKCGGEISILAHKCKHCGTWVEKQCPVCGEWILADAKKCKFCNTWLNKFTKEKYEPVATTSPKATDVEDDDDEGKRDAGCLLEIESVIIAIGASFVMGWVGVLVCLIVLEILLHIRALRFIYCLIASLLWGVVGFSFGGIIGGIIALAVSLLFHAPAMQKGFN